MKRSLLLSTAALGIAILPLGAAQADGLYAGAFAGFSTSTYNVFEDGMAAAGGPISGLTAGGLIGFQPMGTPWHFEGDIGWNGINGTGTESDVSCDIDCAIDVFDYGGGAFWHIRALYDLNHQNPDNLHILVGGGVAGLTTTVNYESWRYVGTSVGPNLSVALQGDVAPNFFLRGEALVDFFGKHDLGTWGQQQIPYSGGPGTVVTGRLVAGIRLGP
jgi:hypothetical protein